MGFVDRTYKSEFQGSRDLIIVDKELDHLVTALNSLFEAAGLKNDGTFGDITVSNITYTGSSATIGNDAEVIYNNGGALRGASAMFWDKANKELQVTQGGVDRYNSISITTYGLDNYGQIMFGAVSGSIGVLSEQASAGSMYFQDNLVSAGKPGFGFALYRSLTPGSDASLPSPSTLLNIGGTVNGSTYHDGVVSLTKAGATGAIPGCVIAIQRNSSGNGAAGALDLSDKAGTHFYHWVDANGKLRIGGSAPTEDGTTVSDTSGTQVGTRPGADYVEFSEMTAPSAPSANGARLFTQDNGAGKTQLCVRFNTGATQVIATEP
jgi:hypothetical protein